jgi:hypothetical protein
MGAGFGGAGLKPAGFSIPVTLPPPDTSTTPWGLFLDGATRDVPVDQVTGQYQSVHPVDAEVELVLGIALGKIPVAQDLGQTFEKIPIDEDDIMTADADRRVRRALATLLTDGDVVDLKVTASAVGSDRVSLLIEYANARLRPEDADALRPRKLLYDLSTSGP